MNVRGAPAIGVTAAMGMVLAAIKHQELPPKNFFRKMNQAKEKLQTTRPTAVNLFHSLNRIYSILEELKRKKREPKVIAERLLAEAKEMWQEDVDTNLAIGKQGAKILEDGDSVLTHCNAGSLGTFQHGTALSVIRWAVKKGNKNIQVIADETRPRLQGARITAFELQFDNIPVKVECDNTAGLMMKLGKIQKVIVGADRIVQNAVFNKIGTYMVAITAKYHNIPFYVAAPKITLGLDKREKDVEIEQCDGWFEVALLRGRLKNKPIVPKNVECLNYAFDPTPMELSTGIITEDGIFNPSELLEYYLK